MKWLKWTLLGTGGLLLVLIVLVVSFLATFDPNAYKEELAQAVREQTGRDLSVPGEIRIAYFPWLGFEVGEARLGNASGFGDTPFAAVSGVRVKVEVLPLLRRVLSIDVIELEGLRLDLQVAKNGRSNWDDLAGGKPAGAPAAGASEPKTGGEAPALAALSVGGLRIADAAVRYRDAASGQDVSLSEFGLKSGRVTLGEPFALEIGAKAAVAEPQLNVELRLAGKVTADPARQHYSVRDLDLAAGLAGAPVPGGRMDLKLAGALAADLAAQTATVEGLQIRAGELGARLDGTVSGLDKAPSFELVLDLPTFDARALMKQLALAAPQTADKNALAKVAANAEVAGDLKALELKTLKLALDDTEIEATARVQGLDRPGLPRIDAEMNVSGIDLDRYLPPRPEGAASAPAAGGVGGDEVPLGIPVELLRDLRMRASVNIGKLKVMDLNASDLALTLVAEGGMVRLDPMNLSLYEGLFKGATRVDVRGERPAFAANARLASVKAGPLLADFMGDDKVHGQVDADLNITTAGDTIGALKRALDGRVALSFRDGAVKDFNLAESLRQAEAKLKQKNYQSSGTRPTDFSSLTVSGVFENGVLSTRDLDMRAPLLRAAGQGQVDVAAESLNYLATVTLTDKKTGQGGEVGEELQGLPIPIRIKGGFGDPKVSIELANALQAKARGELESRAAAEKARLAAEAEQKKAEAAARLEAEKARARAAVEEKKKAAEQKLREDVEKKLKKLF